MKLDQMDAAPLTPLQRRACQVVGISAILYRMGKAIQDRAPEQVCIAWKAGDLAINEAYRLTLGHTQEEPSLFEEVLPSPPTLKGRSRNGES